MKNVHLIKTDKPSRLCINGKNQIHIYITNSEEIKEGDYCISHLNIIDEGKIHNSQTIFNPKTKEHLILLQSCRKIILTTDQDLIKDGVQAIPDEFLEWFVKNPSCEEVVVNKICNNCGDINCIHAICHSQIAKNKGDTYKIIIPKEESKQIKCYCGHTSYCDCGPLDEPKQETVEERKPYWDLVDKKAEQNNTIDLDAYAKGVQDGAKWQQERMYSEEDLKESFMACWKANVPEGFECKLSFKEWFKQYKKK